MSAVAHVQEARTRRIAIASTLALAAAALAVAAALAGPVVFAFVGTLGLSLLLLLRFDLSLLALNAAFYFGGYAAGVAGPGMVKLLGVLTIGAWLLDWAVRRVEVVWVPHLWLLVAFVAWTVPSALLAYDVRAGSMTSVRYAMFAGLFFFVVQYATDERRRVRFIDVSLLAATASALVGLTLFLIDQASGSASGPLAHNDFAFVLAPVLSLAIWRARHPDPAWVRPLAIAAAAIVAVTVLATLSRGAIVALVIASLWLLFARRGSGLRFLRRPAAVVFVVAVLVAVLAAGLATGAVDRAFERKSNVAAKNAESRTYYWEMAGRQVVSSPLFGVGPGNYRVRFTEFGDVYDWSKGVQTTHNTYLNILAELGVGGFALFVAYLVVSWRFLRLRGTPGSAEDELQTALAFGFIVTLVAAAFLTEQYQAPIWMIPALAAVSPLGLRELRGRRP